MLRGKCAELAVAAVGGPGVSSTVAALFSPPRFGRPRIPCGRTRRRQRSPKNQNTDVVGIWVGMGTVLERSPYGHPGRTDAHGRAERRRFRRLIDFWKRGLEKDHQKEVETTDDF